MNRLIPFLLLVLAVLNMPQARVLCVGIDGHIAIEPAGHDHHADGSHACGAGLAGGPEDSHCHLDHQHGRPCTDIPMPAGAGYELVAAQRSESSSDCVEVVAPVILVPEVVNTPGAVAFQLSPLLPSRSDSLRCTILQV